jgi:putative hemolysin
MLGEVLAILLLILLNGLFAGAEIALVSVDRMRVRQLVEEGRRGARRMQKLRAHPERLFATIQIMITVVSASAGAVGGAAFARDLAPLLWPLFGKYATLAAYVAAVGSISLLSLILGELVPKSLALRHAERYALLTAPLLDWLGAAMRPLVWLLTKSSNAVLRVFGSRATFAETRPSPAELRDLVDEATEAGSLDEHVGEIASRALAFAELTAAQVMVPRTRVVGIPAAADLDQIKHIVLEHPHSRFPVYERDLDEIVGYILSKDLLAMVWQGRLIVLQDLIRPPYFVAQNMLGPAVLHEMRERRLHLAIVMDEHGGTAGIITLDDMVEELTGEILGEIHNATPALIHVEPDGSALVRGDVPIRELNRELDLELAEGDGWNTIGGLGMYLANGVPKSGTLLKADDGTRIKIEDASERAVKLVRVLPPARVK